MTMLLAGAPALLALPQKVIHRRTCRVEGGARRRRSAVPNWSRAAELPRKAALSSLNTPLVGVNEQAAWQPQFGVADRVSVMVAPSAYGGSTWNLSSIR